MAAARGEEAQQLASIMYDNTMKLFFNKSWHTGTIVCLSLFLDIQARSPPHLPS